MNNKLTTKEFLEQMDSQHNPPEKSKEHQTALVFQTQLLNTIIEQYGKIMKSNGDLGDRFRGSFDYAIKQQEKQLEDVKNLVAEKTARVEKATRLIFRMYLIQMILFLLLSILITLKN